MFQRDLITLLTDRDYFDVYFDVLALMQNREFETVLAMAERFSGCLSVSRD